MKIHHADHGIPEELIANTIKNVAPGFFAQTFEVGIEHGLMNALYGPACGDPPVGEVWVYYKKRSEDRPPSRMTDMPHRPTRLLTIVGIRAAEGEDQIFTAYGGPLAEREPGDPSLNTQEQEAAKRFWGVHALAGG